MEFLDTIHHDTPDRHIFGEALLSPELPKPNGLAAFAGQSPAPARADHIHPSDSAGMMAGMMTMDFRDEPTHTYQFSPTFSSPGDYVLMVDAPPEVEYRKKENGEVIFSCSKEEEIKVGWVAIPIAPYQENMVY